jgi:betaine-aldehyde dehydrogenase
MVATLFRVLAASMELGGKSALVVFEDADVEKAVEWAMVGGEGY